MGLLPTSITSGTTGAIADHNQAWSKLNQYGYDVKADFRAVGDGIGDDTAAITACLAAAPAGSRIYFPPGSYIVSGSSHIFTLARQNLEIYGSGIDSSVLKLKSGNGDFVSMFTDGATSMAGLHVHDLTTDQNATGNAVTSIARLMASKYRILFNCAEAHNSRFERVRFTNSESVCNILLTDSNNVHIYDCVFDGVGPGAFHDHSCINIRGDGTRIRDCRFVGVGPAAWTAIEIHGSNVNISGNLVYSFARVGITSGDTVPGYNGVWSQNQGLGVASGVEVWAYDNMTTGSATAPSVRDLLIEGNRFQIDFDRWAADIHRVCGVNLQVGSETVVERVKILNNFVTYLPFTAATTATTHIDSAGVGWVRGGAIVNPESGKADTDIEISGNVIQNSISAGITIEGRYAMSRLRIRDNTIIDPGAGHVSPHYFKGIVIHQPQGRGFSLTDAVVSNNQVLDTRAPGKITAGVDTTNVGYATGNRQFNNFARRTDGTAVRRVSGNESVAWATS
jgi:hypothetical protein